MKKLIGSNVLMLANHLRSHATSLGVTITEMLQSFERSADNAWGIEYPYTVLLQGEEPWVIMAPDDEQAAWNALSLSESLSAHLIDVYRDEGFS